MLDLRPQNLTLEFLLNDSDINLEIDSDRKLEAKTFAKYHGSLKP